MDDSGFAVVFAEQAAEEMDQNAADKNVANEVHNIGMQGEGGYQPIPLAVFKNLLPRNRDAGKPGTAAGPWPGDDIKNNQSAHHQDCRGLVFGQNGKRKFLFIAVGRRGV